MSITQLMQHQGAILAVTEGGNLILWDLNDIKKIQGTYVFKDNLSLLPSKGSIKIDAASLKGIKAFNKIIVIYSKQTIYITNYHLVLTSINQERFKGIHTINCANFLIKKEAINCLATVSQETVIFGTNKGNIYKYDLVQNLVVNRIEIGSQQRDQQSQAPVFATLQKQPLQVNSIQPYSQFALVGLSNGKAYSIRTQNLQTVFELTANLKTKLQSVQKIVISADQNKIYILHENYITQWSLKLCSCLSYIEYPHPKDLLIQKECITIIGSHPKLIWYDTSQKEYTLSMRSAQTIKGLADGLVAVGGSDQMIDILTGGMRLMTLFFHK